MWEKVGRDPPWSADFCAKAEEEVRRGGWALGKRRQGREELEPEAPATAEGLTALKVRVSACPRVRVSACPTSGFSGQAMLQMATYARAQSKFRAKRQEVFLTAKNLGYKKARRCTWYAAGFMNDVTWLQIASSTAIMALSTSFQVSGLSRTELSNMQPSQQMCFMPRASASLSQ